ncbi:Clp protease ClpP [Listeria monocytogenes]|uniref:head maturation protease, ClpP-related n=1 Tax=Listeria TaxID=1637 RepID=UPI00083D4370|nr:MULTISPECIES: head maturation protease, ClpP-related [Listeria]EAA0280002.1 Clp protease ClpP [Listeria monocytogenes]EAD0776581.1 Clp protease ClpP [Listeria monocytogenes]EAE1907377.1 Clp protease ClpP [Listeria monocytogenes]EAE8701412.1 Clp protease ClpP [Listeria monocytogenes]EAF2172403.1 Clp protease ClpP [Listeria monocytogenes]
MKRIDVKGVIVSNDDKWIYDYFEMDSVSPNDISEGLKDTVEPVEVVINSGGGNVYAGSEIYSTLKDYEGDVTVKIIGLAASAASVIAMAGSTVKIAPTAQLMIHNVSSMGSGDFRDFQHQSGVLENYNKSIASAYMLKSGKEESEVLEFMNNETWFTAEQAKGHGFVDEIMFAEQAPKLAASITSTMLPESVINKIRNSKTVETGWHEAKGLLTKDDVQNMINEALEQKNTKEEKPQKENKNPFKRFLF